MARPLRLEFSGALYHITSRGNARENIFLDQTDRKIFLSILSDTVTRFNWVVHAYCLMLNHYHLLLETPDPNLSQGMRQLNGVYTQAFNRRHQRVGHIFQGRYKSILVEKGTHLLELCRYIVLNPIKAGFVDRPESWRWSSYKATAGTDKAADFLTTDWVWGQFSQKIPKAKKRYTAFVSSGMKSESESPWRKLQGQIFFGSTQFISQMRSLLGEKKKIGEIPKTQRYPGRPPLRDLFRDIPNRRSRNEKIKSAHLDYGYTLTEIASVLGIHYTTVSRIIKKQGKMCQIKT